MHAIAFRNGRFVDAEQLVIPPYDAGFLLGVTISEQIRTFNGQPFWLKSHLQRLYNGLALANIDPPVGRATVHDAVMTVTANNYPIHASSEHADIGITVFVTPGAYASYGVTSEGPLLAVHSYPLQFQLWAGNYVGQRAIISSHREVPVDCWPPELKCRSRMHYFLAGKEAREKDSRAIPILCDHEGYVTETPIASVVAYSKNNGFSAPKVGKVLPGISLDYVRQLAARMNVPFHHVDLSPQDLFAADEVILTSTPFCAVPLIAIDNRDVGNGSPGAMYKKLIEAWNADVGLDITQQALRFAA